MVDTQDHEDEAPGSISLPAAEIAQALVANHREFLAFVERRVGDRALAEEILQNAFVKNLDKLDSVRDTAVGWFYRVLRNAIIDHARRRAAEGRKLEGYTAERELLEDLPDDELRRVACKCVVDLAATLKPEYAAALHRIEIDGVSVKDYATEAGISTSNAGVRVFRAREALRKQVERSCGTCATHGCIDCSCGATGGH